MTLKNKIIIFDLDGVLVDTTELVSTYLLGRYPTLTKEIAREMLVGNFHEAMEKIKLTHAHAKVTEEEKVARSAAFTANKSTAPLFEGIFDLLKRLHERGYVLVINTSALAKNCLPILEKLDILKLFDFVATAEISKSKVEKFKIIEEKYHATEDRMLFVTDTLGDVKEAKIAGVRTVAVTWGAHDRGYFTRETNENLIAIVDSVEELERTIEAQ